MSVKIDLLPPYVAMRRRFNTLVKFAIALPLLAALILGLVMWKMRSNLAETQLAYENLADREQRTQAAEAATTKAEAEAAPIKTAVQFVVGASQTGPERAALLNIIRNYIYPSAEVLSIDISDGKTVKIVAKVETPDEYANFLYRLRSGSVTNGGSLFAEDPRSNAVTVSGVTVPGGPNDPVLRPAPGYEPVPVVFPLTVNTVGLLKDPVEVPSDGTAPAAPAGTTTIGGPSTMPGGGPGTPPGPAPASNTTG